MKANLNRRKLISRCASGIAFGSTIQSSLISQFANALASTTNDYKALVCINLTGGNDSFNSAIPNSASEYQTYSNNRRNLAIPQEQLLPLINNAGQSLNIGLAPQLTDIAQLFNQQKLSMVANVGNLIEPTLKSTIIDGTANLPPFLFSHNDQQKYSHTLNNGNYSSGWAGRLSELLQSTTSNQQLAMNISISGDNYLQRGLQSLPYTLKNSGVNTLKAFSPSESTDFRTSRASLYRSFLNRPRENVLQQEFSNIQSKAWALSNYVADILSSQPEINMPLMRNSDELAKSLSMVSKLLQAREAFELKRQIFYVELPGFDTHSSQANTHPKLLQQLNSATSQFTQTLETLGLSDNVTTFTLSEFGRTLTINGTGTDHGWGGHHFVTGGAVTGGNLIGEMPSLEPGSDDDAGEGRIIPTTSFDSFTAELCRWFGLSQEDLEQLLPNSINFTTPLGLFT